MTCCLQDCTLGRSTSEDTPRSYMPFFYQLQAICLSTHPCRIIKPILLVGNIQRSRISHPSSRAALGRHEGLRRGHPSSRWLHHSTFPESPPLSPTFGFQGSLPQAAAPTALRPCFLLTSGHLSSSYSSPFTRLLAQQIRSSQSVPNWLSDAGQVPLPL